MIETIEHKGIQYSKFQASGNAARFIIPFALEVCKGEGFDIGYGIPAWKLPGAIGVEDDKENGWNAKNLPPFRSFGFVKCKVDYIFSSHCLEHVPDWMKTLDYWIENIKSGGVLFLYLPELSQGYWSFGNPKHVNIFTPEIIRGFMVDRGLKNIFVSGVDLNNSFAAMAEIS